ncbi:hypothetical protein COCON_G00101520 [Conger conger]|uniref:Amino acid transporter n=1 Tax=Conger conger TaxID=82655 RepID=A0A9Q1DIA6_CONCO|nr:hypothetical protein COCON_G00101520 [Conger conger]
MFTTILPHVPFPLWDVDLPQGTSTTQLSEPPASHRLTLNAPSQTSSFRPGAAHLVCVGEKWLRAREARREMESRGRGCLRCWSSLKRNLCLIATIAAVVLGVVLGLLVRDHAALSPLQTQYLGFPGEILMRMLNMVVLPLIISSIITGAAALNAEALGSVGLRVVICYLSTTAIAVCLGITMVTTVRPGLPRDSDPGHGVGPAPEVTAPTDAMLDLLRNMVPENLLGACFQQYKTHRKQTDLPGSPAVDVSPTPVPVSMATLSWQNVSQNYSYSTGGQNHSTGGESHSTEGQEYSIVGQYYAGTNIMGLIVFCLLFGLTIGRMGERGRVLVEFFNALNEATMRIVQIIMCYMPVGIVFLIAVRIVEVENWDKMQKLGLFMVTVLSGLAIHACFILPLLYVAFVRRNPFRFAWGMAEALVTALMTSSRDNLNFWHRYAARDDSLRGGEEPARSADHALRPPAGDHRQHGRHRPVRGRGRHLHRPAQPLPLGVGRILTLSITATLASIGAAGIPSAGAVTTIMVLSALHLPLDDVTLLIAVDWLLDRFRTAVNVLGDAFVAGIIQKLSERELGRTVTLRELDATSLFTLETSTGTAVTEDTGVTEETGYADDGYANDGFADDRTDADLNSSQC